MRACCKWGIEPKRIISTSLVRVIQDIFAVSAGFIQSSCCAGTANIGSGVEKKGVAPGQERSIKKREATKGT